MDTNIEAAAAAAAATTTTMTKTELTTDLDDSSIDKKAQKEREDFDAFVADLNQKIEQKSSLRTANSTCVRPSEDDFGKLDSNLKRNTAFVKKLKQFTAAQLDGLLKDMATLNLTKYISEIGSSLVEAKLKMTDIPAVIILCSRLHQIYADFAGILFENWQKVLAIKPGEKISNASKLRVDLRLFAELIAAGIFSNKVGLPLLGATLTSLIQQDKDDHSNLSIILSFCRHCGEEYAGLIPRPILEYSKKNESIQLPTSRLLPSDKQQNLKNLLRDYFGALTKHLKNEHKNLQSALRINQKIMESKGEVSTDRREKLDMMQSNFDKLLASVQTMSDLLNEPMPELPKDEETVKSGMVLDMIDDSNESQLDPWGDEETKSFYVDLPDLRDFLPNYAPKQSSQPSEEPGMTEETLDMEIDQELLNVDEQSVNPNPDDVTTKAPSPEPLSEETVPSTAATAVTTTTTTNPTTATTTTINGTTTTTTPSTTTTTGTTLNPIPSIVSHPTTKHQFDVFLHNLTNCVNKELIDSAAIEFLLNFNTKNNRKKLTNTLFGVQRTRLDILPFFARLVATINLVAQDVATELAQKLKNEFKYHITKKNQMNIESKIKVVRFIGEMVKFNMYSKIEGLFCLKVLLHDFQHHQIEMTCAFLEVAGQYLYNTKESRLRTNVYLEQMMRLKTVTALDSRHVAQIENCYYLVKPPDSVNTVQKVRPPMHQYIRHLVFEELSKSNVDKIIKLMRRLDWNDPDTYAYAIHCLSKAYNLRYHLIRCLADVMSGISSYQDKVVVKVIDSVFEDIRAGLEIHSPKLAQRRVAMAKYLGELYNYRLVESTNILNTLYSIISLGVTFDHSIRSEMDPPESLFRLKLACVLLDTCGQYFTSVISRKRLDYFLVFFQHYYWFKKSDPVFTTIENTSNLFPILVDHMYKECLANVRPKLKLYKTYDESKESVEKLRLKLYPNLFSSNPSTHPHDGSGDTGDNNEYSELDAINEDSELTDQNDLTEDTSEAIGESDDEHVRGRKLDDELMDDDMDLRSNSPNLDADAMLSAEKKIERTQEDIEFEQAFEKMAADSYQERLRDPIKPSTKDIPVPIMPKASKKTYDQLHQGAAASITADATGAAANGSTSTTTTDASVPFVLMLRGAKGGKQQFKTFAAPTDSALAVNLRMQEQKIREENEKVKRLTLNITERIEEEDYQISLMQCQRSPAENRSQKQNKQQKYKHQKGAPDADLIFS